MTFFFTKSENRRAEWVLPGGGMGVGNGGLGRTWGKGVGRWKWCKYCVHKYKNGKMRAAETVPGIGGRGLKGEWWRGWIQVRYIWYIVRMFVNATMHLQQNNFLKRKKCFEFSIWNFSLSVRLCSTCFMPLLLSVVWDSFILWVAWPFCQI
jgi:hypothetical protein